MQSLKELKAAVVKRRRSKKEKKREKRAWELRTNDGPPRPSAGFLFVLVVRKTLQK